MDGMARLSRVGSEPSVEGVSSRNRSTLPSPKLVAVGAGRGDVADEWSRPYILPACLCRIIVPP